MNRRGFFKAMAAIAAMPVAWKMGKSEGHLRGDDPTRVTTYSLSCGYAVTTTTFTDCGWLLYDASGFYESKDGVTWRKVTDG